MLIIRKIKGSPLTHDELDNNFKEVENLKGIDIPESTLGVDGDIYIKTANVNTEQEDNIYHLVDSAPFFICFPQHIGTSDIDMPGWIGLYIGDLDNSASNYGDGKPRLAIKPAGIDGLRINRFADYVKNGFGYTSFFINDEEYPLDVNSWSNDESGFVFQNDFITSTYNTGLPIVLTISFMKVTATQRAEYYKDGDIWIKKTIILPSSNQTENGALYLKDRSYTDKTKLGKNSRDFSINDNGDAGSTEENSFAEGYNTVASGRNSHAEGNEAVASGESSHAEGYGTKAFRDYSHAEGYSTKASGSNSHAEGYYTVASNESSHAEGYSTEASNENSHAEGNSTKALGMNSHAEGSYTEASNENSHAEGINTKASRDSSHAEGSYTVASGMNSHAEGNYAEASNENSHAEGNRTKAAGMNSHAEGSSTAASGEDSHAEGYSTAASKENSHAEGYSTVASGRNSHAEGDETVASGESSHAEGYSTEASRDYSHAEGSYTKASGRNSHAEGYSTKASSEDSHAEGNDTEATGESSHAEGNSTIALNNNSHAAGVYNIGTSTETIHETGIGISNNDRKNAFEIYKDGRIYAPELSTDKITSPKCLVTKEYLEQSIPSEIVNDQFKVVDTLPTASLALFEKARYSIEDSAEFVCIASSTAPATDADCFWLQR